MGCIIKIGNQSVSETDFLNHLNKIININELFEENPDFSSQIYEALGFKIPLKKGTKEYRDAEDILELEIMLEELGNKKLRGNFKFQDILLKANRTKGFTDKYVGWRKYFNVVTDMDTMIGFHGYVNEKEGYTQSEDTLQQLLQLIKNHVNEFKIEDIILQQKQQAQQLYSQYLEQNPNGSVEQFKSWVDEFNRDNQKLNSNIQIFSDNNNGNFDSSSLKDDDLALMLFNQALGLNLTSANQLTWNNIKDNIFFEKEDGSLGVKNLAFVGGNLLSTKRVTLNNFLNQKGLFPEYKVFIGESVIYPNVFEVLEENEIIKQAVFENLFNLSGAFEQVKKELNNHSPETFVIETPHGKFTFPKRFASGFFKIASTVELLLKENQSSYIQDYLYSKRKKEEAVKDGKKVKPVITQTLTVNDTIVQNAIGLIGNSIIENAIKNNTSVKIQVFSNAEYSEDGIAGWYITTENTIYLHESMLSPQHLSEGLPLIAHELLHSVTSQSLLYDEEFSKSIRALLKIVKDKSNIKDFYGFKNEHEFLSEAFSSQEFRQLLKNTKFEGIEELSVWQKFINAILKLFGKNVKYTEKSTLATAEEILNDIINDNQYKIQYIKSNIIDKFNTHKPLSDFITQKSQEKLKAIQEIFNSSPELSKVGDVFSYAIYLDTIFPDSKVKDIVYHGTKEKFETFSKEFLGKNLGYISKDSNLGFFFGNKKEAKGYGIVFSGEKGKQRIISAILNIEKPRIVTSEDYVNLANKDADDRGVARRVQPKSFESKLVFPIIQSAKTSNLYDGVIFEDIIDYSQGNQQIVFEPEQIHVLSSKADIQGFKDFMAFENSEFSKHGTYQQFRDFITSKFSIEIENRLIETGAIYNAMSQVSGIKLIWQDKIEGLKGNTGGYLVDLSNYNYNVPILYGLQNNKTQERISQIQDIFNENPELVSISTPEQYSQYLDTILPDSKVEEIDNSLYISVLNQLEQENIIEKDCTGGGKLKAEKGLQTNFTKGGKWKLIKDLKGYPTHKEGGVDLTISKNGVSIKNGNTEFIAKHGLVLPNNKKNNFEYKPYAAVQDNTYVAPKVVMPLELKKKQQFVPREQPVLKADTRTDQERKIAQEYTKSVLNPSISTQIGETFQKPLRWLADPVKGVGDIVSAIAPKSALAKDLPNTNEETFEYRKKQLNPYIYNKEKINNTIKEARDLTINSLINVGTMELGFALPRSFVSPAMTNMFKTGSKANFAADLLQLSKTDLDKIGDGDMNEIANVLLNSASLSSKMDNFDASTIYNNIKNWKNISKADKIDTYKDIFNISQSINQQTQRNEK